MSVPARFPSASGPGALSKDAPNLRDLPHTTSFGDALGERQLVFDPGAGTSLEVLRFAPEFSSSPEFEAALRARVETVHHLQHPSLSSIHAVERKSDSALCLISKNTPGRRVSELLPKAHGPAFALELIRLVTPALATLQRAGENVAHGALSADRIVVTRDGRLVLVEHVLGAAVESLRLPRKRLIEFGIVVPAGDPNETVALDARTDLIQLSFLALALLLGRKLDAADYPTRVQSLLDEFALKAGSPMLAAKLRTWLERAMQLSTKSFANAKEAQAAIADLPDDLDVQAATVTSTLVAFPKEATGSTRPQGGPQIYTAPATKLEDFPTEHGHGGHAAAAVGAAPVKGRRRYGVWIGGALAVLAAAEGVALFVLPYTRPATETIEVRPASVAASLAGAAPTLPAPPALTPSPTPSAVTNPADLGSHVAPATAPAAAGIVPSAAQTAPAAATAPVPAGPRFGGLTVSSPLNLQVFEAGKLLGSTSGPIAINEGSHSVELVNDELGFRLAQTINVRSGQMTTVNVAVPKGRISINAVPWAEVDIDGTPAGQTPIANHSLPIGSHEIVFRHPQLGVRKQTVIVKVDGLARVTQTFSPGGQQ